MSSSPPPSAGELRGPIAWMVRNNVTANLLMLVFIVGGLLMSTQVKQEVFPEFELDTVTVRVPYPGASPEEVERGILLAIEEEVRGINGVEEVTATAAEGSGTVSVALLESADPQQVYQDVQQAVARLRTLPDDAEEPQVSVSQRKREVLDVQVYGDVGERALREAAEGVRERLLAEPGISQVEIEGARDLEVHVEVPQEALRAHGLTLDDIARSIRASSIEIPGGRIETAGGELLLRVNERRDWASEFADIPIVATADGAMLRVGDIASVRDGFEDVDREVRYDGMPAITIEVYRVGDETPIGVSEAGHRALEEAERELPAGIFTAISRDSSEIYKQRLHLLLRNALLGLLLVLVILGIFLEIRLAFWVTIGIPTAFLGGMLFLPGMGVSINMVSMFAFIIALGIVVDDAIVAGENIYEYRQRGMDFTDAAIRGARDVIVPITFSILTNILAFLPLLFVPGIMGQIWRVIPAVVTAVFLISWVESLLILPAHLAHGNRHSGEGLPLIALIHRGQQWFSRLFMRLVERVFGPFLAVVIRVRYLTVALALTLLGVTVAWVASGRMGIILMPKVESDRAVVTAVLPLGSPADRVAVVADRLLVAATTVAGAHGGEDLVLGIRSNIDENRVETTVYLTEPEIRPISTGQYTDLWRDEVGEIVGLQSLRFESDRGGPGRGPAVTVELAHRDVAVLDIAGARLAEVIEDFGSVRDVDDGYTPGKPQLSFRLTEEGRSLGLTSAEVARQVRNAFYGAEAVRQQRGRNEVKVQVRLPEDQRASEYDIEELLIRAPSGRDVPLRQVAEVERGRAYTTINHRDGRRTVTVTANVVPVDETSRVLESLTSDVLPDLVADFPGLAWSFEGRQAEMRDSMQVLGIGFLLSLFGIYFLLAVPFRSYTQPFIVMMAIPFGIIGAAFGHILMDYSMSVISLMGVIALSGVVVNDSLVMIDYANRRRRDGDSARDAIHGAGVRRFRPILLTTLTTFGGLGPMIFETSRQARFMIPMAISLGFGIVFATAITLVLIPCLYMIREDIVGFGRIVHRVVFGSPADGREAVEG